MHIVKGSNVQKAYVIQLVVEYVLVFELIGFDMI